MANYWIEDEVWNTNRKRIIDDKTLCDLLGFLEYQAERHAALDDIGIQIHSSPDEVLYDYVLDALNVPADGHEQFLSGEHKNFVKTCKFSREWFYERFYGDYILEHIDKRPKVEEFLEIIRYEVKTNLEHHYE